MTEDFPSNEVEFHRRFHTEEACLDYLLQLPCWPEGFRCSRCGHDKYWISSRGLYLCRHCDHQHSVTAGTIFHGTRKPLRLSGSRLCGGFQLERTESMPPHCKPCWGYVATRRPGAGAKVTNLHGVSGSLQAVRFRRGRWMYNKEGHLIVESPQLSDILLSCPVKHA